MQLIFTVFGKLISIGYRWFFNISASLNLAYVTYLRNVELPLYALLYFGENVANCLSLN